MTSIYVIIHLAPLSRPPPPPQYPKARAHALVLAREPDLLSVHDLRQRHVSLLRHMLVSSRASSGRRPGLRLRQAGWNCVNRSRPPHALRHAQRSHVFLAPLPHAMSGEGTRVECSQGSRGPQPAGLQVWLSRAAVHAPASPARHLPGEGIHVGYFKGRGQGLRCP